MAPELVTISDLLHWSYANLAMAHAAVESGSQRYGRVHFIIRAKLFKGLRTGTMRVGSLAIDEKAKLRTHPACVYCGATDHLSADHVVALSIGGLDRGENLVSACRRCNSSKRDRDMLEWWQQTRQCFPPLMLLRRYLKLALEFVGDRGLLATSIGEVPATPFRFDLVPKRYPAPSDMTLDVAPRRPESCPQE